MVGVGRDLCGSSGPTPLAKQGHLEQAAQDRIQVGFEYLQRRRLHNPSGQPGSGLCHPQSNEILPRVQVELESSEQSPCGAHVWVKEHGAEPCRSLVSKLPPSYSLVVAGPVHVG